MAASATFALKAGVWFRRGRLFIVSPDSLGTACPLSGRNSTYRPVQILEAGSLLNPSIRIIEFGRQDVEEGLEVFCIRRAHPVKAALRSNDRALSLSVNI